MKNYKIIDTFMFNGEFEMLKMRLDYLYDSVDHFIICESDHTQNGNKKNLTYSGNEHLFSQYSDKLHYIVYRPKQEDILLLNENRFHLEQKHMDFIRDSSRHLSDNDTVIMLSGVDEFPDKNKFDEMWDRIKDKYMDAISFKMKTFYCSPICELDIDCFGTTVVNNPTFQNILRFSDLRQYTFNCPHIENGGWHLSFFHTPEEIKKKIESYSHSEYNTSDITNLENIKKRMYNYDDVLNRSEIKIIKHDFISSEFPIEFYRHDIFFRNTFERNYLKPQQKIRKKSTMQIPLEIENLQLMVAKNNSKVVVEIGTANGGTLARWFEIPCVETIISIDYPIGIHGGQGFEERTYVISDAIEQSNLVKKEFYPVNGDSKHPYLIDRIIELLNGRKIDFLFIDGDHTYDGVKGDFENYRQFLHDNSIVAFHDIIDSKFHRDYGCFVADFWNELKTKYKSDEIIHTNLLDEVVLPGMHSLSSNRGGFGGIGVIHYNQKPINNISLLIPVYNNVNLAIENINKTLSSSKFIDEVIVYSNGTNREENEILISHSKTNPIFKIFINDNAIGFVKAVNEGIKKCKNELILCMNSDAHFYGDWERRLRPIWENPKNGLLGPVLQDNFILGCSFIMKKSILNKVGFLNEGFGLGYHDDGEISERVLKNGYDLGYCIKLSGWGPETTVVDFPLNHIQGVSFMQLNPNDVKSQLYLNEKKLEKFRSADTIKVFKNANYDDIKRNLNTDDVFLVINNSGKVFEKIRFDQDIVKMTHIFECTSEMNIDEVIESICKGKKIEFVNIKKNNLTWLAKFDDHSSMGILSQKIIENLKDTNVCCKKIIGETETKNQKILSLLNKEPNNELGIMFSYPDMIGELSTFKTKVIYTGVDTTGGIPNFAQNCNKADFLLTPSNISKKRMEDLGVTKPIFFFPHGIEKDKFKFKKRKKDNIFKFLYVGECSERKGTFHLVNAFIQLFGDNPNVELILRSNDAMVFYGGDKLNELISPYNNIHWDHTNTTHDELVKLYDECHVYVYPSRADTFGMTLLEAMSSGLPIISTNEPGVTELIDGRYDLVHSDLVEIENHPWMLGKWGNPSFNGLKSKMIWLYENYDTLDWYELENHSKYVNEELNWEKLTQKFQTEILPKLKKEIKILTLLTSYERPNHIPNVIESFKQIREDGINNHVYIVENSESNRKEEIVNIINLKIDENFTLYVSEFNMGQRGALLQVLDMVNIDDYDFVQFSDQDNIFKEPLSTYCDILLENQDITFVTGYMSKEHGELGWRQTRFGNLCEKRSLRAGHMFMRVSDLKKLFPLHLDAHYGQPYNSSWNAGLDWELTYWNPNSIGKNSNHNFVLCVPGGVLHVGYDSTIYEWPVEENEYTLEELETMR